MLKNHETSLKSRIATIPTPAVNISELLISILSIVTKSYYNQTNIDITADAYILIYSRNFIIQITGYDDVPLMTLSTYLSFTKFDT
jgi:hypothetical protein